MLSKKKQIKILITVKLLWHDETNQKYRFNNQHLIKLVKRAFSPPIHVESGANTSWSWNKLICLHAPSETRSVWLTFCWLNRRVRRCVSCITHKKQQWLGCCFKTKQNLKTQNISCFSEQKKHGHLPLVGISFKCIGRVLGRWTFSTKNEKLFC